MSKNILWTGSHGFVAGYAIPKLLDAGHKVWGIDNFWKYGPTTREYDEHPNFTFFEADAKDAALLKKIMFENKIQLFVAGAAIIGGITMFHELAYDIIAENEKQMTTWISMMIMRMMRMLMMMMMIMVIVVMVMLMTIMKTLRYSS